VRPIGTVHGGNLRCAGGRTGPHKGPVDVDIVYIEDTGQVTLANAAHATEIPGLDMSHLTPEQRESALQRLNEESCTCGCNLTVAQCRINDSTCGVSPGIAQRIVDEESRS